MKKTVVLGVVLSAIMLLAEIPPVMAQGSGWSQATACPGWNNPANFSAGDANNYYQGQTGSKEGVNPPNVMTGYTDMSFSGTMYTGAALANVTLDGGYSDCATFPSGYAQNKAFAIMSGSGYDPNTGNQLPLVPTQFNTYDTTGNIVNTNLTKSIRIGDACGNTNATALYYNVKVTPANAMFYIYYACVIEAPGHGTTNDPAFIIRVMKKNASNQWVQINDTLAYMVPSTPSTMTGGTVTIGQDGWHSSPFGSYEDVYWKEWSKVALNLSNYLYQNLRIEVMISDCGYTQHFAYAYIAGECRQMSIGTSGCPSGMATDVTTLMAPRDMKNYVWYACEYGKTIDGEEASSIYTWRQLTPDSDPNGHDYNVQADDFRITRRFGPNGTSVAVDSIDNWQTFRCKLTSALDPAKPFDSYLYAHVQNTKPSMSVDSLLSCDGGVKVLNTSEVPGAPALVLRASTQWNFYNNPGCNGDPVFSATGDSVEYSFADTGLKGLRVRTLTCEGDCYSEAIYPIQPRLNPNTSMHITERVLCDDGATTLIDNTEGTNNRRTWYFLPVNAPEGDMTLGDSLTGVGDVNRTVSRSFSHAVEPIGLRVYNGSYCLDRHDDTIWCQTYVRDTVSVFLHPDLEVTGDTVVCEGHKTDATVRAIGVDNCTYEWSLTDGQVTGGLPAGPTLRVVPYADRATYFVKVTSPQGCVAWDSIHAYMVRPKLAMVPDDGRICPGDVATLTGTDAHHYSWTASPADPSLEGQERANQINVSPKQTTVYTMVGHGANNCDATPLQKTVTVVPLPVSKVSLSPEYVDVDDPIVVLRDVSAKSVSSSWLFNDGSMMTGKKVSHTFENSVGYDSVDVTLTSYNELGCPKEYPFRIPVSVFTAWFPNIFTPNTNDGNSRFEFYTVNEYQNFHIYIYNRRGELVYDSDDVHFSWDGTCNGKPLPQGTYVYSCRFLKPGTTSLRTIQGSVTLVR
ncbi:MAG: gliding motility-associated C-terminal domain-containing protein [bacterium]